MLKPSSSAVSEHRGAHYGGWGRGGVAAICAHRCLSPHLPQSLGWVTEPQDFYQEAAAHTASIGQKEPEGISGGWEGAGGEGSRSPGRGRAGPPQLPCSVLMSSWKSCLVFFFMMDSQAPISADKTKKQADVFLILQRRAFIVQKNTNFLLAVVEAVT